MRSRQHTGRAQIAYEHVAMLIAFYGSTPAYREVLELGGWGELQPDSTGCPRSVHSPRCGHRSPIRWCEPSAWSAPAGMRRPDHANAMAPTPPMCAIFPRIHASDDDVTELVGALHAIRPRRSEQRVSRTPVVDGAALPRGQMGGNGTTTGGYGAGGGILGTARFAELGAIAHSSEAGGGFRMRVAMAETVAFSALAVAMREVTSINQGCTAPIVVSYDSTYHSRSFCCTSDDGLSP